MPHEAKTGLIEGQKALNAMAEVGKWCIQNVCYNFFPRNIGYFCTIAHDYSHDTLFCSLLSHKIMIAPLQFHFFHFDFIFKMNGS